MTTAALLMTACGTTNSGHEPVEEEAETTAAVESGCADVDGALEEADFEEVARAADLVALGRVIGVSDGIRVDKSTASYRVYTVQTAEHLHGTKVPTFEVATMTQVPDGAPICFNGRPQLAVGDEALWFVDALTPPAGMPLFVLASSASVLAFDGSGDLVNQDADLPLLAAAGRLGSKDAIVEAVTRAVGPG